MEAHVLNKMNMASGRFVRLELIEYRNAANNVCYWEAAQRNGSDSAAIVIATMKQSGRIILIRQFRPPVGAYSIEFPAGLIDEGEKPEQAAVREMKEETGYSCNVLWSTGLCSASPGMIGEKVAMVFVEIDEELPENQVHKQDLQDNEEIEVFALQPSELGDFIKNAVEKGDVVCSRLATWCAARGISW